ncbi:MAG TPA: primosomal protein N' [Fibrobacteraceae bacterium]|nr:primosomal protein N' [Fibrobacteraceae bacterium]
MPGLETADRFPCFADVVIPGGGTLGTLTYGIPEGLSLQRGSVVYVSVGKRPRPSLALVAKVHTQKPTFAVKPLADHSSHYLFAESYLELMEWCSKFYCAPLSRSLDVFWPSNLDEWLTPASSRQKETHGAVPSSPEEPPPLTPAQEKAIHQLSPLLNGSGFRGALLHGVTGSGKTRVYLELVQECLHQGGRVLILVPEIALTPQTCDRFQRYCAEEVLMLHSNLSAPARRHVWKQLLRNKARIVLGTRSAILAPFDPQLIILDEEHDGSYKQQDPAPRYHCREVAFHRAHHNGALVVLGSATPSLESWEYARRGHLHLISLLERARPVPLPQVRVVNLRTEMKQDKDLQLSPALREALSETISRGQQAIVLHNRRGFSTSRICMDCGHVLECQDCKVPVVFHLHQKAMLCHYCGRLYAQNTPCPDCGGHRFVFSGGAIEKVEQEILEWVPRAKVLRMDRDTVQNIGAAEKILNAFRAGEANILLGTQMVAKGHDFPNVQLVGVVAADTGSTLPDFRSSERTFQLLTQVAGRAGRAQAGGQVILQTWNPEDPVFRFALHHDYTGFSQWELANRQELGYPPFQRLLCLEISAKNPDSAESVGQNLRSALQALSNVTILGPVDAFISKVRGIHRKQLLLKAATPQQLRQACELALAAIPASQRHKAQIKVDMDPMGTLS